MCVLALILPLKKKMYYCDKVIALVIFLVHVSKCQIINRPPQFVPGSGDMSRFSLSENTPVGSPIYQLRGKYLPNNLLKVL